MQNLYVDDDELTFAETKDKSSKRQVETINPTPTPEDYQLRSA
jgi:hypothetical protein